MWCYRNRRFVVWSIQATADSVRTEVRNWASLARRPNRASSQRTEGTAGFVVAVWCYWACRFFVWIIRTAAACVRVGCPVNCPNRFCAYSSQFCTTPVTGGWLDLPLPRRGNWPRSALRGPSARGKNRPVLACFGLATNARSLHLRSWCPG